MADETQAAGNQFAVVCTGYIGPDFTPVTFKMDDGTLCPVVIKLCRDRAEAEKFRKRLLTRHARVGAFKADRWAVSTPIYGYVETDLTAAAKRQGNPNAFGRGNAAAGDEGKPAGGKGKPRGK